MADGNRSYYRPIVSQSGYVLMLPNVGDEKDLLQSFPPDPGAQSQTQQFPLGTKLIQGEKVWRYCKNGAGTPAIRDCLQGAVAQNAAANLDIVVQADVAAAAYEIPLTSQAAIAVAKDYYKEGHLFVNVGTGLGQDFKIKSHTALVGTTTAYFTLYEPVRLAIETATAKVGLRKNLYDMVITAAAPLTNAFVGVNPVALTAAYYFWAQTGGPAIVRVKEAITVGQLVLVGVSAGEVSAFSNFSSTTGYQIIGIAMATSDTENEYMLVHLTLDR